MTGIVFSLNIYSLNDKNDSVVILNSDGYLSNNKFSDIKDLYITVATPPGLTPQVDIDINNRKYNNIMVTNNTIKILDAFPQNDTYHISIISHLVDKNNSIINGINIERNNY